MEIRSLKNVSMARVNVQFVMRTVIKFQVSYISVVMVSSTQMKTVMMVIQLPSSALMARVSVRSAMKPVAKSLVRREAVVMVSLMATLIILRLVMTVTWTTMMAV